jgi:hypothetical protein
MSRRVLSTLCMSVMLLVGATLACGKASAPPSSTPIPPEYLLKLPTMAQIECPAQEHMRGVSVLWEHTERPPHDESSTIGERGKEVGEIHDCESIEILDYEWSSFRQEFWVLVDNGDGQRGWLAVRYIEFEP